MYVLIKFFFLKGNLKYITIVKALGLLSMPKVKVYSTPNCPWCDKVKEFLAANKIEFEDINVSVNREAAREMIEKTGQKGVPVIDIDGKVVIGFDEKKLRELLKIE